MKLSTFAQVTAHIERPTYRYAVSDVSPAATATDVLVLSGSASKRAVRIHKVRVLGSANAHSLYEFEVLKRTAANTAGTATNPTPAKMDSLTSAATATLALYSANPSALGAGVVIASRSLWLPNHSSVSISAEPEVIAAPVILRGPLESLAINFRGGAVPAGASLHFEIEWSEDGE
jgi:hypothetical protein